MEFHIGNFIWPEYPHDLSDASIVKTRKSAYVSFSHSPAFCPIELDRQEADVIDSYLCPSTNVICFPYVFVADEGTPSFT